MDQCLDCYLKAAGEAHCPQCVSEPLQEDDFCSLDGRKLCDCCEQCRVQAEYEYPAVKPYKVENDLKFYAVWDILQALFGDERLPYAEMSAKFSKWCDHHNVHYYGRPRESFWAYEGETEARDGGFDGVALEDLS